MEDRLHGLADSFRRERDDALRRKMTAQERLTLKKQEVDAMTATLNNLEEKQKQLKVHMSKAEENEELRREVSQLTKEVEFQHAQLLNKREKAEALRGELAVKVKQRQLSLAKVCDLLHQQRERNQQMIQSLTTGRSDDKLKSVEAAKELLLLELENDHDGHNLKKWRDWVQVKIQFLSDQGEHKRRECARLETIIEGYRTNMRLSVSDSKEKDETSGDVVTEKALVMMECSA
ncbi:hypothetical protein FisN_15Lh049 [Fistulifera solaris]|uniref:Uncharacterized protein n=1 Tax=Fistulifera solaris TaxID=1519565 RepID=A0A1Z5KH78_FISSO|nr:hypothetical protein FisN_15Lh049 [Fistulifera solaris]|eukprot:GAX25680.1 hypothetical protein FisN_15Lh049 [Fistulifera solaris]